MSTAVNPTNYDMIPTLVPKEKGLVFAVIETPARTRHKYAFEPKYGIMRLKNDPCRRLNVPVRLRIYFDVRGAIDEVELPLKLYVHNRLLAA